MKTKTKSVLSDEMLSVLALRIARGMNPEPHSGQSGLTLIVPFTEFVKVCNGLPAYGEHLLGERSSNLVDWARTIEMSEYSKQRIISSYMMEIAYAQLREISYQQQFGVGLTKIRHLPQGKYVVDSIDVRLDYYANKRLFDQIIEMSDKHGYPVSTENLTEEALEALMYSYALVKAAESNTAELLQYK